MRLLLIDNVDPCMLALAMRWQDAGHQVRWFFRQTERNAPIGKGLVAKVDDWREWIRWADLVILADNTKYLRELDVWRSARGVPIIGATQGAAEWELDRTLGQRLLKKVGVPILPFREFTRYDDAIAYVKRENRRFVSKPLGDEPDKSLSYVAKSAPDLIYMLERWKKKGRHKSGFILQEHVSGCEMAVGGFFGPSGFAAGWWENWEFKALMPGDKGPNCGEMGTVIRLTKTSRLADKMLKPLEGELERLGYTGYVDVNCIVDEAGNAWPLEFTMRFGWPTFNIQQELFEGDSAEWLADLSGGRDAKRLAYESLAVGVVMALPQFPYPGTPMENVVGVPVYGLTQSLMPHVHPGEMMMGAAPAERDGRIEDAPMLLTAGTYVLVASGRGESVRQAAGRAYRVLDRLSAPASPFWRTDIGARLKTQLPAIQAKGYAKGMAYST